MLGLTNGANVTSFTDSKTGNPNPLSNTSAYPTFVTNASTTNLSAVNFNGSQFLTNGGSAISLPLTVVMVFKVASYPPSVYGIVGCSGTASLEIRMDNTGVMELLNATEFSIGASSSAPGTAAFHMVVLTLNSTNWAWYIDGTSAGGGSGSYSLNPDTYILGAGYNGTSDPGTYVLAEVQIYSSVLNTIDLAADHVYISSKWGTP